MNINKALKRDQINKTKAGSKRERVGGKVKKKKPKNSRSTIQEERKAKEDLRNSSEL